MKTSLSKKAQDVVINGLLTQLCGLTMDEWIQMLRKHDFAIDPPYWPRAALITGLSLLNSAVATYEERRYGRAISQVEIKQPVFVLGHMRSGTTFLYQLLAVDQRFAYPTIWQAFNPHTFLTTEPMSALLRLVLPETRKMDSVRLNVTNPIEDRIAIIGTLCSPAVRLVFPRTGDEYERFLTLRDASPAEVARWKAALRAFYQKLTWKNEGRPLLIKSPQHMGRIRLLLELFPDARFVHIYRNPFDVYRSTRRLVAAAAPTMRLQRPIPWNVDELIIKRYQTLFDAYFEEKGLIPPGRLHELRFEDLERDPMGEVRKIYSALDLPDFSVVAPALQRHVASLANYQKNKHASMSPDLRRKLVQAWRRNFETWGYPDGEERLDERTAA